MDSGQQINSKPALEKGLEQGMALTHFYGDVENATASSAGDTPNPNGQVRLGQPLPFRTGSGEECLATEVTENTEASHLKHPG